MDAIQWFVAWAAAMADASGAATLRVEAGLVDADADCPHWRPKDGGVAHEDPLSEPAVRLSCAPKPPGVHCMDWRASVVL